MLTLSSALLTDLGLTVTRPGYLIELGYSTILRLSTMGDISWNGQTWAAANVKVQGMAQDGSGSNDAAVILGNADNTYGALVLNEGAGEIAATVYVCYAGATATADVVRRFYGVTDSADFSDDGMQITLRLVAQGNATLFSPRVFINKAAGFNFLQPAGTKITVGNETYVLER